MVILLVIFVALGVCGIPVRAANTNEKDELNSFVESKFKQTHYTGMSVQIVSSDDILFTKTYGDVDSLDDGFIIGSLSKSLTAVCVMQLVEEDKIYLDEAMKTYLPNLSINSNVTVRQFLNQNSGVGGYDTIEKFKTSSSDDNEFMYSNVNYTVLAQLIEKITGKSYSKHLRENVLAPLEMNHSFTNMNEVRKSGMTKGHQSFFGQMLETEHPYPSEKYSGRLSIPTAYVISSTNDMGKYLQFYLNNGNPILSSASLDKMIYESVDTDKGFSYGMGLGTTGNIFRNEFMIYHSGSVENYNATMIILPERDIAIIAMFNGADYFVSNHISENITMTILGNYLGISPTIEEPPSYTSSHMIINIILIVVSILSIVPTIFYFRKGNSNRKYRLVIDTSVHFILPAFVWAYFLISGMTPTAILDTRKFLSDVFIVLVVSFGSLLITGIVKLVRNKK